MGNLEWPSGEPGWDTNNKLPDTYAELKDDMELLNVVSLGVGAAGSAAGLVGIAATTSGLPTVEGKPWYDTTTKRLYFYSGSAYEPVTTSLNPRLFGARGDGTTDDRTAIMAAFAMAETIIAAGEVGVEIRFPGGRYRTSGPVQVAGSGIYVIFEPGARIQPLASYTSTDPILEVGSYETTTERCGIIGAYVHGNKSSVANPIAGISLTNMNYGRIENCYAVSCAGDGIASRYGVDLSDTSTWFNHLNHYAGNLSRANDGCGMHWVGEKTSTFVGNRTNGNGIGGFWWEGSLAVTQRETTQCAVSGHVSATESGYGYILDGTARYTFASCVASISAKAAIKFQNTNAEVGNSNSGQISAKFVGFVSRRCGDSAGQWQFIETSATKTLVSDLSFDGLVVQGGSGLLTHAGMMDVRGWAEVSLNNVIVKSVDGGGYTIHIREGQGTDGATVQSSKFKMSNFRIRDTASSKNSGEHIIQIEDSTSEVNFSDGEIACPTATAAESLFLVSIPDSTVGDVTFDNVRLTSGDDGQEVTVHATPRRRLKMVNCQTELNHTTRTITVGSTTLALPPFGEFFTVVGSGAYSVDDITSSHDGRRVIFQGTDSNVTFVDSATVRMNANASFAMASGNVIEFVFRSTAWFEVSRSVS